MKPQATLGVLRAFSRCSLEVLTTHQQFSSRDGFYVYPVVTGSIFSPSYHIVSSYHTLWLLYETPGYPGRDDNFLVLPSGEGEAVRSPGGAK